MNPPIDFVAIIQQGLAAAPFPMQFMSCARVYVGVPKEHAKGVKAAAKKLGLIFQAKGHYGFTNVLYVGYDNAKGDVAAKGNAIAKAFNEAGVPAYIEYGED